MDTLESLVDLLEAEDGYEVKGVSDFESALTAAVDFSPDVAVLDVNLRTGSGLDLIPSIKASNPDIACIVLTGFGSMENSVASAATERKRGFVGFEQNAARGDQEEKLERLAEHRSEPPLVFSLLLRQTLTLDTPIESPDEPFGVDWFDQELTGTNSQRFDAVLG